MKKDRRRRAREAALQILYQWDVGRGDVDRAVETFFDLQWPDRAAGAGGRCGRSRQALARDTVAAARRPSTRSWPRPPRTGGPNGWRCSTV